MIQKLRTPVLISTVLVLFGYLATQLFTASTSETKEDESFEEKFKSNYSIYALNAPRELTFAGEEVPVHLLDVKEKMDRELLVNTYWQSQTMLLVKRSNRWFPVIEKILEEQGVPEDFKYLALIESGLTQVVSPAGAVGFWQLMKSAARERGLEVNGSIDERYHIEKSTLAACKYLKEARERFGSWTLAAASYNMGMAGLSKQMNRQKATNYYDLVLNEETSRYVFRILAGKLIVGNPESFGFRYREKDLYQPLKMRAIEVDTTVHDLAKFAFSQGINYKALKYLNPWLRDSQLPNSSGRTYRIDLPTEPLAAQLVYDKQQVANFTGSKQGNADETAD